MNFIKEKIPFLLGVLAFLFLFGITYYYLFIHQEIYYLQIDNTKKVSLDSSHDMKYQYTLYGYREDGRKKEITFKASRELREGAFLMIEYMEVTGVHSWKEVQYKELPKKVKQKYLAP